MHLFFSADWPKLHKMFKARDAKTWQRIFPVRFLVRACALNVIFINILSWCYCSYRKQMRVKQNMSCCAVDSFDFALENLQNFPLKICGGGGTTEIQVSAVSEIRDVPLLLADPRDLLPHPERGYQILIPYPNSQDMFLQVSCGENFGLSGQPDRRVEAVGPCEGNSRSCPRSVYPSQIERINRTKRHVVLRPCSYIYIWNEITRKDAYKNWIHI